MSYYFSHFTDEYTEDLSYVTPIIPQRRRMHKSGPSNSGAQSSLLASVTGHHCLVILDILIVLEPVHLLVLFSIGIKQEWSTGINIGVYGGGRWH